MPENSRGQVLLLDADVQRGEKLKERETTVCFHCRLDTRQEISEINHTSRASNIESDNSQNFGLEDYNNISDGIRKFIQIVMLC